MFDKSQFDTIYALAKNFILCYNIIQINLLSKTAIIL